MNMDIDRLPFSTALLFCFPATCSKRAFVLLASTELGSTSPAGLLYELYKRDLNDE